ncbi:uncharacterized protein LOC135473294 [Liolophura sinensis]|uniref:uncharacterized protein LOC135473294 n=1 Tax=Liolophura sinensis TaxID=3198878 RepID=UPI0031591818
MEDASLGESWSDRGSHLELVPDKHGGLKALKSSQRSAFWMGPGQNLKLKGDTSYAVSGYAKMLNNKNGTMFQKLDISGAVHWTNGRTDYFTYASRSFLDSSVGWFALQGSFHTPSQAFTSVDVYVQGPDPGVDFLLDDMSLTEVDDYPGWKEEANARVEKYRKSDAVLRIQLDPGFKANDIELQINHVNHSFGFGTVVSDAHLLDPNAEHYRELLFQMFNWYTIGSYKWKYSHGTPNHPDYREAIAATEYLKNRGLPVRAHNMFWAVKGSVPSWVWSLSGQQVDETVNRRISYMTNITRGKVEHWDVNNELLHGQFFEEATGDRDYSKKMFARVHQADPDVKLFLNDYDVVARGGSTGAYVAQAKEFKTANVGLYGLGLQGHFRSNIRPDPALLKLRLDLFSTVGLPLWITELDLYVENETTRADWYETAWRMFFSCPAVEGIIMWGFWDRLEHRGPGASLVNGNNFYINEAGQRWLKLTKEEWSTKLTYPVSLGTTFRFRGFRGDYEIIMKKNGNPIKVQTFTLDKSGSVVDVLVDGDGHTISVSPKPTLPPFISGGHSHKEFTINPRTVGHSTSGSGDSLQCVSRYSGLSQVGDDQKASISCEDGEVMTSCSMQTKDNRDFRDGDQIEMYHGKITCIAVNAFRSAAPVQAIARCCKLTGMSCSYEASGPTPKPVTDGDQAVTTCPTGSFATGCTSYTYFGNMDGAFHRSTSCVAQMDGTNKVEGGVFSYAACCSAPRLNCRPVTSENSGGLIGDTASVQCHPGEAMTGCSVMSDDGRTAGAYITEDELPSCVAVNGGTRFVGEKGVVASAMCCLQGMV